MLGIDPINGIYEARWNVCMGISLSKHDPSDYIFQPSGVFDEYVSRRLIWRKSLAKTCTKHQLFYLYLSQLFHEEYKGRYHINLPRGISWKEDNYQQNMFMWHILVAALQQRPIHIPRLSEPPIPINRWYGLLRKHDDTYCYNRYSNHMFLTIDNTAALMIPPFLWDYCNGVVIWHHVGSYGVGQ